MLDEKDELFFHCSDVAPTIGRLKKPDFRCVSIKLICVLLKESIVLSGYSMLEMALATCLDFSVNQCRMTRQ